MLKELKRSRKSPVLCTSLPSFCSSSSSGISFLLKAATFSSSFQACSDLFFTKSQRADSGMNLRELTTLKEKQLKYGTTLVERANTSVSLFMLKKPVALKKKQKEMFRVSLLVFESLPSYHPKGEGCRYMPTLSRLCSKEN